MGRSILAVTTWEGTPAALLLLTAASREAAPIHEKAGARNPRMWRAFTGGTSERMFYSVEFDDVESYGRFSDSLVASGWWDQTVKAVSEAHPNLKMIETTLYINDL